MCFKAYGGERRQARDSAFDRSACIRYRTTHFMETPVLVSSSTLVWRSGEKMTARNPLFSNSLRNSDLTGSVVRPALEALDRKIMAELDALTIADLMRPIVEQGGGI